MNMLWDSLPIILPAFIAGIIVLISHIPLGQEVVKRGIIFIDLAIAQMAGLGIIFAASLHFETEGWQLQLIALTSAIAGAIIIALLEKIAHDYQEALIGICFVLAASTSLLLLAKNPHGGEHLQDLLSGQILWVTYSQLVLPGLCSLIIFGIWLFKTAWLQSKFFYLFFAIAITQSVQLVGVYLVFSSLVIPALASAKLGNRQGFFNSLMIGILAYGSGLLLSIYTDLPSGAIIVWALVAWTLLITSAKKFIFNKSVITHTQT